jgi:hypothetical protein
VASGPCLKLLLLTILTFLLSYYSYQKGRWGEAWESSNKMMFFLPPQPHNKRFIVLSHFIVDSAASGTGPCLSISLLYWRCQPTNNSLFIAMLMFSSDIHGLSRRPTHRRVWLIGTRAERDPRPRLVRVWGPLGGLCANFFRRKRSGRIMGGPLYKISPYHEA